MLGHAFYWIFCTMCIMNNEAYMDFSEDLDYASVSGIFIPIKPSFKIQTPDALSARSINSIPINANFNTFNKLYDYIQDLRNKKIPLYNGCKLDVDNQKTSFKLTAGKECPGGVNIGVVLKTYFDIFDIDTVSSGFVQSNKILFKDLLITQTYVTIHGEYKGDYSHTQSMLKFAEIDLKLDIPRNQDVSPQKTPVRSGLPKTNSPKSDTVKENFNFLLTGKFNDLKTEITFNLTESSIAKISIEIKDTTVEKLMESWKLNPSDLTDIGFPFEKFKDVKIDGFIKGLFNTSNNHFQLFAMFKYNHDYLNLDVYLILNKASERPVSAALVVKLNEVVNIVDHLKKIANYEGPDFIKHLVQSCTLSVSSTTIDLIEYEGFLKLDGKVQKSVQSGINIFIETDMKKALKNCADQLSIQSPKKRAPLASRNAKKQKKKVDNLVKITLSKTGVVIKLPEGFSDNLKVLMKCFLHEMKVYATKQALNIPSLLADRQKKPFFYISELSFGKDVFQITAKYTGDIEVPGIGVKISNSKFSISRKKPEGDWIFNCKADIISNILKDPKIKKGKIDFTFDTKKNFQVSIKIPAMQFNSFAEFFGVQPFDGVNHLEKYFNLAIKDFYINGKLNLADKTGELTVTGSPVINGMSGLTLAVFIWRRENSDALGITFGFVMKNMRLDEALKSFSGVEMPDTWLSDMSIVMLASNADKDYCKSDKSKRPECQKSTKSKANADAKTTSSKNQIGIPKSSHGSSQKSSSTNKPKESKAVSELASNHFKTIDELRDIEIVKGLILKASIEPKAEHCHGNGICQFLVDKQVKELSLKGRFTTSSVTIEAGISVDIKLGGDVTLKSASLVLEFGSENNKVSIKCEFHTVNPPLKIAGFIEIDLCGKLRIGGTMEGMIKKPFNIQWLSFGNLKLSFGLDLKTALPSIEMGADVWLGDIDDKDPQQLFKFQGYFGFDATSPSNCFFYARSFGADLTIGNIFRALKYEGVLPQMVAESGFKDEIKISFNLFPTEKKIEEFGFSIPPGFVFKGKISILGYNIECDLRINHKVLSFFLDAKFDPIDDWGFGLIKLYRTAEDHSAGPILYVNTDPKLEVCIRGYINILGVGTSVNIELNKSEFSFKVSGDFWGVLTMSIEVKAAYTEKVLKSFSFEGCVGADITALVSKAAIESIKEAKKKAAAIFLKANTTLDNAKKDVEAVRAKIQQWNNGIEQYKNKLIERGKELEKEKEEMEKKCGKGCGKVCVPFYGWVAHCTTIWGRPVGCLKWDKCKWKAPNLICMADCQIKKGLASFAAWAEQLGIKIMLGLSNVGQFFGNALSEMTKIADGIIAIANSVVELAKDATMAILTLAEQLMSIKIESICLNAQFDPKTKTCVGYKLKGSYLERMSFDFQGSICIDLSVFKMLGSTAAVSVEPKIEKLDENAANIDAKVNEVDRACKQMESNASRLEDEVKSTTTVTLEKRSHVYTEEELRIHRLAYDPLPQVNLRSEETNSVMADAVPWEYINVEDIGMGTKDGVVRSLNFSARHQIPIEESHDFCHQHQSVLSRYTTIADGFSSAIKHLNDAKEGFLYQKRSYLNQIYYLNDLIRSAPLNNMTLDEQEDLWHWKDYAEDHIKSYLDKATSVFKGKKRDSINHVRQALNDVIESDRGLKLPEYIKYLHSLAVKADKKSQVNQKPTKDSTSSWHHIKKILLNVATDDNIPTFELAKGIGEVQKMLSAMKRSTIPCAA